jgi:hypothetical protein
MQNEERAELRNLGRRKLEEYRMLKQTLAGGDLAQLLQKAVGFSPTTTLALNPRSSSSSSGISAYRPDGSTSPTSSRATITSSSGTGSGNISSSLATRLPTVSSEGEPSSSSSGSSTVVQQQRHRLAQAQDTTAVEPQLPAAGADPLTDVLLAQLQTLMSEKQSLQQQVNNLLRENEQLTELVGYLSSFQTDGVALDGQTSLGSQLSGQGSGAWWFATLPSAGSGAVPVVADGGQEGAEGGAAAGQGVGQDTASMADPQATTLATGDNTGSSSSGSPGGHVPKEDHVGATAPLQQQLSEAATEYSDAASDEGVLLSLPMPPVAG